MKGRDLDKVNKALETADTAMFQEWVESHADGTEIDADDIKEIIVQIVNFNVFIYAMWLLDDEELPDEAIELREHLLKGKVSAVEIEKGGLVS